MDVKLQLQRGEIIMSKSWMFGTLILGYILLLGQIYSSQMATVVSVGFILVAATVVKFVSYIRMKVENA